MAINISIICQEWGGLSVMDKVTHTGTGDNQLRHLHYQNALLR